MPHRHLTEQAGRDLTKAVIADVIERGDIAAWRGLTRQTRGGKGTVLAGRVIDVPGGLDQQDARVRAFPTPLPAIPRDRPHRGQRG